MSSTQTSSPTRRRRGRGVRTLVAAAALSLVPLAGPAAAVPTGSLSGPGVAPTSASAIQTDFGAAGPHEVTASRRTVPCTGVYALYTEILRLGYDVTSPPECFDAPAFPAGAEIYHPADLVDLGALPLVLWTPGIGTEPGNSDRLLRRLASHGYVVIVGYTTDNWFGQGAELGLRAAVDAEADPTGALHGHIDFTRTVLAGHSAGGGTSLIAGGRLPRLAPAIRPDLTIAGVAAIEPGPATLGVGVPPVTAPTLIATGTADTIVVPGTWPYHVQFPQVQGPAWFTMVRGATHGKPLDDPDSSVFAALLTAFTRHVTSADAAAARVFVGADYGLARDGALAGTERNAQADALG